MTKILCLLWLSSIKLIIVRSTLESEKKSPSIVNEPILIKLDENKDEIYEFKLPAVGDDEFPKGVQIDASELSEIPVDNLLGMVQNKIDASEDVEKMKYVDLLTYINKLLTKDTENVQVFFKNTWRTLNLGLRGSPGRQRSITTTQGMLQPLMNILAWIRRQFYSLFFSRWSGPDESKKVIDDLNQTDPEVKRKFLEQHTAKKESILGPSLANSAKNEK